MIDEILGDQPVPKNAQVIVLNPTRRVTIDLASRVTGLTVRAINGKIDDGVWREGHEWHRAADGRRYVDLEAYNLWVIGKRKVA